jgi:hypothetical protein
MAMKNAVLVCILCAIPAWGCSKEKSEPSPASGDPPAQALAAAKADAPAANAAKPAVAKGDDAPEAKGDDAPEAKGDDAPEARAPKAAARTIVPVPAVPTSPSSPPTAAEWASAIEVNGAEEGKRATNCSMKLLREWVKIRCEGDIKDASPDMNLWHDDKDKGKLWFEEHKYPDFGELTLRISPGMNMGAVFQRKDKTDSARFFFDWPKGADRPKTLEVFKGKYLALLRGIDRSA